MATFETEFDRGETVYWCVQGRQCEEVTIKGVYIGGFNDEAPRYDGDGNMIIETQSVWYFIDGYPYRIPESLLGRTPEEARQKRTFSNMKNWGYL